MKTHVTALALALALTSTAASAQLDSLKGLMGGGKGASLTSGSASNVAGLLQYCVKNNYLGGDSGASGIKDQLLGGLSGDHKAANSDTGGGTSALLKGLGGKTTAEPTQDKGYLDGANGILKSSDGKSLNLGSGGDSAGGAGDLKAQLTRKVCDTVLKQGKGLLGK